MFLFQEKVGVVVLTHVTCNRAKFEHLEWNGIVLRCYDRHPVWGRRHWLLGKIDLYCMWCAVLVIRSTPPTIRAVRTHISHIFSLLCERTLTFQKSVMTLKYRHVQYPVSLLTKIRAWHTRLLWHKHERLCMFLWPWWSMFWIQYFCKMNSVGCILLPNASRAESAV